MKSCELVTLISALACAAAENKTSEELNLLSTIFSQLGDTLSTISANNDLLSSSEEDRPKQS